MLISIVNHCLKEIGWNSFPCRNLITMVIEILLTFKRLIKDAKNKRDIVFVIGSNVCVWSSEEWGMITGSSRPTTDTPSWLQVLTLVF
jgi:hypothetical protein